MYALVHCVTTKLEWNIHFRIMHIYTHNASEGPELSRTGNIAGPCDEDLHSGTVAGLSDQSNQVLRCPTLYKGDNLTKAEQIECLANLWSGSGFD